MSLRVLVRPSTSRLAWLLSSFVLLFLPSVTFLHANAQVLANGQIFTQGLAIVDSPAFNTPVQSGSTLAIAVDVSGDGKLSQAAQVPGSTLPTHFDGLQIYFVSYAAGINITVSATGLLTQEGSSTVKHLSWTVPSCTPPGNYNLTFYENSLIDDQPYFSITPIPVIVSGSSSGQCMGTNQLSPYPQASSPPPQNPWLYCPTGSSSNCTVSTAGATYGGVTPSVTSSSWSTKDGGRVTVTVAGAPIISTIVVMTTETVIETVSGHATAAVVTTSLMSLVTSTPSASGNYVGFIPVNGGVFIYPNILLSAVSFCVVVTSVFAFTWV